MSAEQELKILKDKMGRQELLCESLRKQNKELLEIVRELNDFVGKARNKGIEVYALLGESRD